jgi:teichuronic acid biosynthesis glycosyltransferase TuaC
MKNLRVLTISHMFPSARSERHGVFICREAKYLRAEGIECDFLVGRPWAPWPLHRVSRWQDYGPANPLVPPEGLTARRVSYLRPPGFGFRRFDGKSLALSLTGAAMRWHRENPFTLILGVSMLPDAEAAVIVGQKLGLPVASLAVGSDVMVYPERMSVLWKRLCDTVGRVDLPLGVSRSICQKLTETGQCRREPLCVYMSRDADAFVPPADKAHVRRQMSWKPDNIIAVYVGGLVESKGMCELAAACESLLSKHENFRLVCVGDGPARGVLSRLGEKIGRADAVSLTGRVGPGEIPQFLQGADFLVLPSHSEGMPQAVVEAMNCGLPVVATKVGGVPEAVIDDQTGLLVEARDVSQLREAMERMIVDKAFRLAAGREGWQRARDVFDPEENARIFASALKSLVPACGPGNQSN